MQLGNAKWEHTTFNSRLQPTLIGLGTSSTDSSILKLDYGYGTTSNNGNVLTQTITAPGLTLTQCYGYDALNRLSTVEERSGSNCAGTQQWKQAFSYDRYSNRNFDPVNTTANVLGPNPTISKTNNRFGAGQNYGYDSAGNLTSDPATAANGIVYDGENRQTQYTKTEEQTNSYSYDGDGHRVKKTDNSGTTVFVYNVGGQLKAEYTSGTPSGGGTSYLTSDHLGSTRVVVKPDGSVARHDYLPFGEEIGSMIGGRGSVAGYGTPDGTRQKFTQKERDSESGLDYFLARYYSSAQGRFTSPDEFTGGPDDLYYFVTDASNNPTFYADLRNPQSLNKYQYCYNNPLRYIDPDGHDPLLEPGDDKPTAAVKGAVIGAAAGTVVGTVVGAVVGGAGGGAAGTLVAPGPGTVGGAILGGGGGATVGAGAGAGIGAVAGGIIGGIIGWITGEDTRKPDTTIPPLAPPQVDAQTQPQTAPQAQPQTGTPPQTQAQPMPPPPPITKGWDQHSKKRPGAREKGDERRRPSRQKPPNWKGPWPPKPPKPDPPKPPDPPKHLSR